VTTKEWLMRAWHIQREIDTLRAAYEQEYTQATSITAQLTADVVSGTKNPHKFDKLAELQEAVFGDCEKLFAIKTEIIRTISRVDNVTYRTLLEKRYLEYKTWEQIAVEMNYSYMHICRLHGKALDAVKEVIECYTEKC
jgi:DNA-directed RNA polymerase specialized sigma subunit